MSVSARELPESIQWYEGMLLVPQHFQQYALRQEMVLHYHTSMLTAYHWGIRNLSFDSLVLFSGVLRISEIEAVLPDGLIVYHPYSSSDALEFDLASILDDLKAGVQTVWLCVPARRVNSSVSSGELKRYESVEGAAITDDNTGDNDVEIPRLRPRLSLMIGETPPAKYVSMPIAKVTYKNESYSLVDYVPPSLFVAPGSAIGSMCNALSKRLREKATTLSEKARSPSSSSASQNVQNYRLQIQALVEGLPFFESLLSSAQTHPFQLFQALTLIAGHIAALGFGAVPPQFQPYNHADIYKSIKQLEEYIVRMVREGILESHDALYFNIDGSSYTIVLERKWIGQPMFIGVRGQAGMVEKDVVAWLESAVIGSKTKIGSLREKRILGIPRKKIDRDGDLVPTQGAVLFSLDLQGDQVAADEELVIVNTGDRPDSLRPVEIILYIRRAD